MNSLNSELDRQENNRLAFVEKISNYEDEIGRINAEKHAYQLTQKELLDSMDILKRKNREYLSYINSSMNITDTLKIETVIIRDGNLPENMDSGIIKFEKSDIFGKSSRELAVNIPYTIREGVFNTYPGAMVLNQNIFVEGWLERNTKTKETYVHLRSDYPGLVFNSGMGVVTENGKAYERSVRKKYGIGLAVGPSAGLVYNPVSGTFSPGAGLCLTVGLTYTPKIFQW